MMIVLVVLKSAHLFLGSSSGFSSLELSEMVTVSYFEKMLQLLSFYFCFEPRLIKIYF